MDGEVTTIGGIVIPSTDPVFLAVVIGAHIPLGIACVVTGASAMLSRKGRGRHSTWGTIYFWCLLALFVSATFLSVMRWSENYHLFVLGAVAFGFAWFGRSALQMRWPEWVRLHISGMSLSYVVMLIAFYVDNGKQLPIWKDLPHFTYWLVPLVVAVPLIVWALLRHPMVLLMKRATHVEFKSKARAHRAARMRAHGSCAPCCLSFEWIGARGKGLRPTDLRSRLHRWLVNSSAVDKARDAL